MKDFPIKRFLVLSFTLLASFLLFSVSYVYAGQGYKNGSVCPDGFSVESTKALTNLWLSNNMCCENGTDYYDSGDNKCLSNGEPKFAVQNLNGTYCPAGQLSMGDGQISSTGSSGTPWCYTVGDTIQSEHGTKKSLTFIGCIRNKTVKMGDLRNGLWVNSSRHGGSDVIIGSDDPLFFRGMPYRKGSSVDAVDMLFCVGPDNGVFISDTDKTQCWCNDGSKVDPASHGNSCAGACNWSGSKVVVDVTNSVEKCHCWDKLVPLNSSGNCTNVCDGLIWDGVNQRSIGGGAALSNDPVGCNRDGTAGPPYDGVWTAIGCIPTDSKELTNWAILFGMAIGTLLSVAKIIQGSIMIMTGTGNPDKLQEGKSTITAAIVGLIVIFAAVLLLYALGVDVLGLDRFGFDAKSIFDF